MTIITTSEHIILDSSGQPADGRIVVVQSARAIVDGDLVTTTPATVTVKNGRIEKPRPWDLPPTATDEGVLLIEQFRNRGQATRDVRYWVEVPDVYSIEYADLPQITPPAAGTGVPAWVADIEAQYEEILAAIADTGAANDTIVASLIPPGSGSVTSATLAEWSSAVSSSVVPGTGTDISSVIESEFAAAGGKPLAITRPGEYLTDTIILSSPGALVIGAGVRLKLKPNAAGVTGSTSVVLVTSSHVTVRCEGVIDGARADQNISAFNSAGGSTVRRMDGVQVKGTSMAPLSNVHVFATEITETVDAPLYVEHVVASTFEAYGHDVGAGPAITDFASITVPRLVFNGIDNDGALIYAHAFDLFRGSDSRFGIISCTNQTGDDTSGSTVQSEWLSGATIVNVTGCSFDQVYMSTGTDPGQNKSVGVSLLDVEQCEFGMLGSSGYTDAGMEWGGVAGCQFGALNLDGRYQATAGSGAVGIGLVLSNNGYYVGTASRSTKLCSLNTIASAVIRRFRGEAIFLKGARLNDFHHVVAYGCRAGVKSIWSAVDASSNFNPQAVRELDGNRFTDSSFSYMEECGIDVADGAGLTLTNVRTMNNGQAQNHPSGLTRRGLTPGTERAGIVFRTGTAGLSKTGIRLVNPTSGDSQTFTDAASAAATGGKVLSVMNPERFMPGQIITLVGAGAAGADLVTWVNGVSQEEITVDNAISTLPSVAGTGTISTSGTTVTGSGTAFATEFPGRVWITAGGNTRQIIKRSSNTAAVLDAPFPSNLAGASFTIRTIAVTGMPSQRIGAQFSADTLSPIMFGGLFENNTVSAVSDSTVTATKLRMIATPGQTTAFLNSVTSDANFRAQDGVTNNRAVLGGVGPSSQGGLSAGGSAGTTAGDVNLYRIAADRWRTDDVIEFANQGSSPSAPTAAGTVFARLNGGSKVELCVRFPTGAVQILATEP